MYSKNPGYRETFVLERGKLLMHARDCLETNEEIRRKLLLFSVHDYMMVVDRGSSSITRDILK